MAEQNDNLEINEPVSIFDPEHVQAATLITLLRIYDTLGLLASEANPDKWSVLESIHERGGTLSSVPHLANNSEVAQSDDE